MPSRISVVALIAFLCALVSPVAARPSPGAPAIAPGALHAAVTDAGAQTPMIDAPMSAVPGSGDAASDEVKHATGEGDFIVLLAGEPLATYRGGVPGLEPTSAAVTDSDRLDAGSVASARYLAYLDATQARFVTQMRAELGHDVPVNFRYRYASNGLSVHLTPREARRVARMPGVTRVEGNTPRRVTTDAGPGWIGAAKVWDGTALGSDVGTYGEGVVVGIIDTGINIDHPSFAAVDERGYEHLNPRGKTYGMCDRASPQYDRKYKCNDKLIGLYSFLTISSNNMDPEDDNGHGSHTASTAAGNFVSKAYSASTINLKGTFSGVAPHANIIAYDACYTAQDGNGVCPPDATLAALDQAAADGVDVLNYSIETGQGSPWVDSHMLAFKRLREAGVIAAVSAGNSGPTSHTTNAVAPWMMAVGATTHDRFFANTLSDFAGGEGDPPAEMSGGGLTGPFGPAPVVLAAGHKHADGSTDDGRCLEAFARGEFTGQIVVCMRGQNARVEKGSNALAGGAGGMVLVNAQTDGDLINGDAHALPAVHISYDDGRILLAWLAAGSGHQARIGSGAFAPRASLADSMAAFSSRGPAVAERCCRRPGVTVSTPDLFPILKPDISAPGQEIIAAMRSGGTPPEFATMSGTSMAGPFVAGAAALVRAAHREWTPAEVQSALVSTAHQDGLRKEDQQSAATPFDIGAGRVDVAAAARAGLVWPIAAAEMDAANPASGGDPGTINEATLADVTCLDRCRWTRTVRNPLARAVTWALDFDAPPNMPMSVSPADFTLAAGETRRLTIEADARGVPRGTWTFANLILTPDDDDVPVAHMTVAVYTVVADVPTFAVAPAPAGRGAQKVPGLRVSSDGEVVLDVFGLSKGVVTSLSLDEDPTPTNRWDVSRGGTEIVWLDVPDGARRVVAEVTAAEGKDVDLFIGYDSNANNAPEANEVVDTSLSDGWREMSEIVGDEIRAGRYWVLVQNFTGSKRPPDDITLVVAIVPEDEIGNLSATAPSRVRAGEPFALDLSWDLPDLEPDDRWFGVVYVSSAAGKSGDLGRIAVDVVGIDAAHVTPSATPPPVTATSEPSPTTSPPPPTDTPDVPATGTPGGDVPTPTADQPARPNVVYLPSSHS